jgi:hypothetical protein
MRNYHIDWNNDAVIIVKKGYMKNAVKAGTWEAREIQNLRNVGFAIKDGTDYKINTVQNRSSTIPFWTKCLKNV